MKNGIPLLLAAFVGVGIIFLSERQTSASSSSSSGFSFLSPPSSDTVSSGFSMTDFGLSSPYAGSGLLTSFMNLANGSGSGSGFGAGFGEGFGSGSSSSSSSSPSLLNPNLSQTAYLIGGKVAAQYLPLFQTAAATYSVPVAILLSVAEHESSFRTNVVSYANAEGIMQFEPATANALGINPFDPAQAVPAAAKYLASLYAALGSWKAALAAYNWGIGNVQTVMRIYGSSWWDHIPSSVQDYASSIENQARQSYFSSIS